MAKINDIVVIGSGPAGVSASIPLVQAGYSVMMLESAVSTVPKQQKPAKDIFEFRSQSVGNLENLNSLLEHLVSTDSQLISPKITNQADAKFTSNFVEKNSIHSDDFQVVAGHAIGGLSDLWGASCARFSITEYGIDSEYSELIQSYDLVAKRIGLSGSNTDEMSEYFGLEPELDPPIELSLLGAKLLEKSKNNCSSSGFRLGRPRLAVRSKNRKSVLGCNGCGWCFFGCDRNSIYSSLDDLHYLKKFPNFTLVTNKHVNAFHEVSDGVEIFTSTGEHIFCRHLFIAAGTLSTTKMVMKSLEIKQPLSLLSNPAFSFAAISPTSISVGYEKPDFALSQLAFNLSIEEYSTGCFGMLYNAQSMSISDLALRAPFTLRGGRMILPFLMPITMIGLGYLPANRDVSLQFGSDHSLNISISDEFEIKSLKKLLKKRISRELAALGYFVLPTSFQWLQRGAEAHYAGTLPAKKFTALNGQLIGTERCYVCDASSLIYLPEKPHTFTSMANADRVSRQFLRSGTS